MEEYLQYIMPLVAVCASALLLVLTIERIVGLLGRIPLPGWFVRHRKRWRLRETKRIERITAEIILRMLRLHGDLLDELGEKRATKSYNDMVTRICKKYPSAR